MEGLRRPLTRWPAHLAAWLAAGLSAYALYWVLFIVEPQVYRITFLLVALVLTFLLAPASPRAADRVSTIDWVLVALTLAAFAWPLIDFSRFVYRAAEPSSIDVVLGTLAIALVLEATRRAVGWLLPATAAVFLVYAWAGPIFDRVGLPLLAHRGYGPDRLVGALYMSLEGIFGVPLTVAATYIILFTIYGAALERSGAGRFFIDWALAASGRSPSAPGRSVTLAGFLLGTVSGSGVATTVMLGSVAWPVLRRAGYAPETAGALLSAAGIGALLSPPTLGAAAFLIAEYLRISYLQVLAMAVIPTILYYLSIFLMVRRSDAAPDSPAVSAAPHGYHHFSSLVAIAIFMIAGMSAFKAVFWATLVAIALSYLQRENAITPRRFFGVLRSGAEDVLGVAATTAAAGVIVGVVTLTGLGLKIAGIIVTLAGGTLALTVFYSAIAVWVLGLAVPVTASYIIAAVMVAPALISAGVPDFAAHMFIFYYAVLSEVSPPTALSPFAAAAITGGNPFRTMVLTWQYTLPAFLVPFAFTLRPDGAGLLLRGSPGDIAIAAASAGVGTGAIACALNGVLRGPMSAGERVLCGLAGGLFLAGRPLTLLGGGLLALLVLILHFGGRPARRDVQPGR